MTNQTPRSEMYAAKEREMRAAVEADAPLETIEAIEADYRARIEAL